ncbi:MAG: hypothetical protein HZA78_12560 [Candidatus Schekmanbacteria bacterium]|nr:hypothetical protein [Candidatus Schekmanbacteria bacterium]
MKALKLFWREDCPRCPAAKQLGDNLKRDGIKVEDYDMDTVDGLAEGAFHSVMAVPTMLLVDAENDRELAEWRGNIPNVDEVRQCYQDIML